MRHTATPVCLFTKYLSYCTPVKYFICRRKRGEKGEVIETPANQIMRKLTIERIEELKRMVQEEQQKYKYGC